MRRLIPLVGLLLLSGLSFGQAPDSKRMDAIWVAAYNRMNRQMDQWFKDGDFPRVIQILREQYALFPDDMDVATNLGWMLESTEQYAEALKVYQKFRTDNPGNPDAAFPEANYYFAKRQYDKIPALLEPTMERKPNASAYRILAHAYEKTGKLKDSERIWKMMLEHFPDDGAAKVNLTRVQKKLAGGGR